MAPRRRSRWYDSEGQRSIRRVAATEATPWRRLVSLLMLLGLVVILIQQVSNPKRVAQVGHAIGLFRDETKDDASSDIDGSKVDRSISQSEPNLQIEIFESLQLDAGDPKSSREQAAWEYLLKKLETSEIFKLAGIAFSQSSATRIGETPRIFESFRESVQAWSERVQDESHTVVDQDKQAIRQLAQWLSMIDEDSTKALLTQNQPIRLALDRALVSKFEDGKIWMSYEQVPSLRAWQRTRSFATNLHAKSIDPNDIPLVSVAQLVSTGNSSYRGVPIRFRGTIASVDQRAGKLNVEGWPSVAYRVWWLKPTEISNQPIAIYVPLEMEPAKWEIDKESELEIIGFFTKKVAYAAQKGAELAPVLFASMVQHPTSSQPSSAGPFASWLAKHRNKKAWLPPLDYATPRRLLVQAAETAQANLGGNVSPVKEGPTDLALVMLLEAARFAPELQLLGNAGREWTIGEGMGIGQIKGHVTQIKAWPLRELQALRNQSLAIDAFQRADRNECYELIVTTASSESTNSNLKLFTNQIPNAWKARLTSGTLTLRQPVVINGITIDAQSDQEASLLIADKVAWKVTSTDPGKNDSWEPPLSKIETYLLAKGWDLTQRDMAQQLQSPAKPLNTMEMEGLYSLLDLESRSSLNDPKFEPTSIVKLVKSSQAKYSKDRTTPTMEWLTCDAKIVRVTRIPVESPLHQSNLGGEEYFQLDCMADIGNVTFEIQTDSEPISYAGEYPLTCLVKKLPDWLLAYQFQDRLDKENAENEDVFFPGVNVQLNGWFYRFWSYRTQELSQALGSQHRQVTPLVVAHNIALPKPRSPASSGNPFGIQWLIGIAGIAGIWWFLRWQIKQNDRPKRLHPDGKQTTLP